MSAATRSLSAIPASNLSATMSMGLGVLPDLELHLRIGHQEAGPYRRDHGAGSDRSHVDPQAPERPLSLLVQIPERSADLVDGGAEPLEEAQAGICQRDAAGRAVKQADAEAFLELSDRVAERRGRDVEPRRRRPEAEMFRDRDKGCQIGEIAAAHCLSPLHP
jgi:hypothetical protein